MGGIALAIFWSAFMIVIVGLAIGEARKDREAIESRRK